MCKFAIYFLSIHLFLPSNFFLFFVCFTCYNNNNNNNKFMTHSVTTLQECGHLTVPGVFWQWKTAPSSLLYFLIEVTKIVVTKNGVRRTIYSFGDLKVGSQLFHHLFQFLSVSHFWWYVRSHRHPKLRTAEPKLAEIPLTWPKLLKHLLTRLLEVPVVITVCDFGEIPTIVWCAKSRACIRIWVRAMISLKNSHCGFATQDESKFKTHLQ